MGEIAVRLLQQQEIAILPDVAQVGELVFVVAFAFDPCRVAIQLARLSEQIKAHIGERHILFQHRRVAAPFRQPVPENKSVVGAPQRVQHQRCFGDRNGRDRHVQSPARTVVIARSEATKQSKLALRSNGLLR